MAKTKGTELDFPFYRIMWQFYSENKKEIKKAYTKLTRNILSNAEPNKDNPNSFLRQTQYEAFEMYVFLKEYLGNPKLADLFDCWRRNVDVEIQVNALYTLQVAHNIAEAVHEDIEENFPKVKHIMVHVNPAN